MVAQLLLAWLSNGGVVAKQVPGWDMWHRHVVWGSVVSRTVRHMSALSQAACVHIWGDSMAYGKATSFGQCGWASGILPAAAADASLATPPAVLVPVSDAWKKA